MKSNGRPLDLRYLLYSAMIAAIYAALTLALAPISYGIMQVRISEAMCVLPYFSGAAVPGLFVGCLIANIIGGSGILDVVIGSLATLAGAIITRSIKNKWLAPLPAVLLNAVLVGGMLWYITGDAYGLWLCMAFVGVGQLIACYGLGLPLLLVLERYAEKLFRR